METGQQLLFGPQARQPSAALERVTFAALSALDIEEQLVAAVQLFQMRVSVRVF